jgi:tetratricopeptide (TPR) repeat protein
LAKKGLLFFGSMVVVTTLLYLITSTVPPKSVKNSIAKEATAQMKPNNVPFDTILADLYAKMKPTSAQSVKLLYDSLAIPKADSVAIYDKLSSLWYNANQFEPYIQAESMKAQLVNSEKKLTFVGHRILDRLILAPNTKYSSWMAQEARVLFNKALVLNNVNDSSKVGLGATYIFNAGQEGPMIGISKVKEVADRDSNNVFAQYILGIGNTINGMSDKAIERFTNVLKKEPAHINALLRLGALYEAKGDNENALKMYEQLIPLATNDEQLTELKNKISSLKK